MDFSYCLQFLSDLQKNNNKEWMDANKAYYLKAKTEFLGLATVLIETTAQFDASIEGLDAKKSIFRINRDIRFSKDKSPYKNNFGVFLVPGGKKTGNAGYYFHLQPGDESFIAGGVHMPDAKKLGQVRQEIDYNGQGLKEIVTAKEFAASFGPIQGESLKRPPKGYAADHPNIDLLKLKSYLVIQKTTDSDLNKKGFEQTIKNGFKTMHPFIDYLNVAMS